MFISLHCPVGGLYGESYVYIAWSYDYSYVHSWHMEGQEKSSSQKYPAQTWRIYFIGRLLRLCIPYAKMECIF